MTERVEAIRWRVIGESRRGASHVRMGLRNQDAIGHWLSESHDMVVLAVADGHGSHTFFRSDTGARIAVETAVQVLRRFAEANHEHVGNGSLLEIAKRTIPGELTTQWRAAVENHLRENPIGDQERDDLIAREGQTGLERVNADPIVPYGSTILGVLAARNYILYLQLGDGDILSVSASGETLRAVDQDERLTGNQTYSLCQRSAEKEVRIQIQETLENRPSLILASTDGYSNSFVSDSDFLMIGRDYLRVIRTDGIDNAERQLARFLDETSAEGSGDDVTLGVISRVETSGIAIPEIAPFQPKIDEEEIPMAVAAKLTAELEEARKRINKLDSLVSSMSARIRILQIGLAAALLVAIISVVIGVLRPPGVPRENAAVNTPTVPVQAPSPAAEPPLRLVIGQSVVVMEPGMILTPEQLGLGQDSKKFAEVRRTGNAGLELVNVAGQPWTIKSGEGKTRTIKTGEAVELKTGVEIHFGKTLAKIVS